MSQLDNSKSIEEATREIENLVQQADALRKDIFSIKAEMTIYENETYMNQHKLHIVEQNLIETEKDIEFAMKQENELVCPTCGAVYSNGLTEQMNISSDILLHSLVELKTSSFSRADIQTALTN